MTHSQLPIVDIAPFRLGQSEGSRQAVETIGQACEEIGFFIIVGHGVSTQLIDKMYSISRAFFDLPLEKKRQVPAKGDLLGGLMHFSMMSENLAASIGKKRPGDLKESLDFNRAPRCKSSRQQSPKQSQAIDAVIKCLDVFSTSDNPPQYAPISYGDYADLKHRQSHGIES